MKWKEFTPEEVVILRENPYTLRVTNKTIAFTVEFKEKFWNGLKAGKPNNEILKELGYDPQIFGPSRVNGISYHVRQQAERPERFTNNRLARKPYALDAETAAELPQSQAIIHLQAEVAYLRQEIEFLKKIMQTEITGRQRQ